jgi:hypothetical protein
MYPSWDIVLKAIILLISFNTKPQVAAKKAVVLPTKVITNKAVGLNSNNGDDLSSKNIPAVTKVAAWIKAETGVGVMLTVNFFTDRTISSSYLNMKFHV